MNSRVGVILTMLACAVLMTSAARGQWPYAPPAPPVPPAPLPPPAPYYPPQTPVAPQAVPQQQPLPPYQYPAPAQRPQQSQQNQQQQYAFRPDLTNPEYGQCLSLEKNWRNLWQQYAQGYQRAQAMSPQDPNYAQMSYYLVDLKRRLDAAWNQFSSQCIYFPPNRK
jgi:hypothetical protein